MASDTVCPIIRVHLVIVLFVAQLGLIAGRKSPKSFAASLTQFSLSFSVIHCCPYFQYHLTTIIGTIDECGCCCLQNMVTLFLPI